MSQDLAQLFVEVSACSQSLPARSRVVVLGTRVVVPGTLGSYRTSSTDFTRDSRVGMQACGRHTRGTSQIKDAVEMLLRYSTFTVPETVDILHRRSIEDRTFLRKPPWWIHAIPVHKHPSYRPERNTVVFLLRKVVAEGLTKKELSLL
jgi:hypothetical protein